MGFIHIRLVIGRCGFSEGPHGNPRFVHGIPTSADEGHVAALVERGEGFRADGRYAEALDAFAAALTAAGSRAERAFAGAAFGVALKEAGREGEGYPAG